MFTYKLLFIYSLSGLNIIFNDMGIIRSLLTWHFSFNRTLLDPSIHMVGTHNNASSHLAL